MSSSNNRKNNRVIGKARICQRNGWYSVYLRVDGKSIRKALRTKSLREAELRARRMESELLTNGLEEKSKNISVEAVIEEYLESRKALGRSQKTLGKYRHGLTIFLESCREIGVLRLKDCDLRTIDRFRKNRKGSPKTVHCDLVVIRQLFNFARKRKLLATDPVSGMEIRRPKPTAQPYWNASQVDSILARANEHYRPLFQFLAQTGARIGEAQWLTWDDLDFGSGAILIRGKPGWQPKSKDQRSIPMSPPLRAMLLARLHISCWVFPSDRGGSSAEPDRQLSSRRALKHLKAVLSQLKLSGHIHTFRHSFVSMALANGTPPAVVRRWAGHLDDQILDRYTHVADKDAKAHMDRLFPGKDVSGPDETTR